jgi:hypothetical protein
MTFIVHPDYIIETRPRQVFEALLDHLAHLRDNENVWTALPRDINEWWRQRAVMTLTDTGHSWGIDGPGASRARLAWASESDGRLTYTLEQTTKSSS